MIPLHLPFHQKRNQVINIDNTDQIGFISNSIQTNAIKSKQPFINMNKILPSKQSTIL